MTLLVSVAAAAGENLRPNGPGVRQQRRPGPVFVQPIRGRLQRVAENVQASFKKLPIEKFWETSAADTSGETGTEMLATITRGGSRLMVQWFNPRKGTKTAATVLEPSAKETARQRLVERYGHHDEQE